MPGQHVCNQRMLCVTLRRKSLEGIPRNQRAQLQEPEIEDTEIQIEQLLYEDGEVYNHALLPEVRVTKIRNGIRNNEVNWSEEIDFFLDVSRAVERLWIMKIPVWNSMLHRLISK